MTSKLSYDEKESHRKRFNEKVFKDFDPNNVKSEVGGRKALSTGWYELIV